MNRGSKAGAMMARLRKEKKLTQAELAQELNVSQRMVAACEAGERRPSVDLARRISSLLGMDWTDFYREEDEGGGTDGDEGDQ